MPFKRICPIPLPTEQEQTEIAQRMLHILLATPPEQWDEYLEPDEPLPPETEFVDHQCPECKGWRLGFTPNYSIRDVGDPAFTIPRTGHRMECSRWKRYWPEDRKDTL